MTAWCGWRRPRSRACAIASCCRSATAACWCQRAWRAKSRRVRTRRPRCIHARRALMRARRLLLYAVLVPLLCGCATLRYYSQAVSGQLDLMRRAVPIDEQLARDAVPAALKAKLQSVLRIRRFASLELGLPDNGSYRSYADLGRPY